MLYHGNIGAVCPHLKLLYGGGAEGVGGAENDLFALVFISQRHFADGGGFAGAVYADHDYDRRLGVDFNRLTVGKHFGDDLPEHFLYVLGVFGARGLDLFAKFVADFLGGVDRNVRHYEYFLKLLEKLVVDFCKDRKHSVESGGKRVFGLFKTLCYFAEKTHRLYSFPSSLRIFETPFSCMVTP